MKKIVWLPGDGIGPEILAQARRVVDAVAEKYGMELSHSEELVGGAAIDGAGNPFPDTTREACLSADAVMLGAVGGPKWDHYTGQMRCESGLLAMRKALGVYANLRPVRVFPALIACSPLKNERIESGLDIMIVRELTGGIYFGEKGKDEAKETAWDTMSYSRMEIERVARLACKLARGRKKRVTSVDKANVLVVSQLWRKTVNTVAEAYPDIAVDHLYVDNAAMQLVVHPERFDVIVTGNLFGDILSDEAAVLTGSLGMLPSASLGDSGPGLFEPIHGSAPDIAGQDMANPIGTILSAAMMLRYGLGNEQAARDVENAVDAVLDAGYRTADIARGGTVIGCDEMGRRIAEYIRN